jgi:hypothetical protein
VQRNTQPIASKVAIGISFTAVYIYNKGLLSFAGQVSGISDHQDGAEFLPQGEQVLPLNDIQNTFAGSTNLAETRELAGSSVSHRRMMIIYLLL